MGGDHDKGQFGVIHPDLSQQLTTVHVVHLHIADHHVHAFLRELAQCVDTATGFDRLVTAKLDGVAQCLAQCGVVFYDQNFSWLIHSNSPFTRWVPTWAD